MYFMLSSPFSILYNLALKKLVFDKRVLKSTMRSCEGIDEYAQHDRHNWCTVMNGMHDGQVLLHLLICFSCPVLPCTCMYDTHTGYSWSFTITCTSMFLCRDYYFWGLHPRALTLGASIVRKSACYYRSNSMQIQVVSLLHYHYTIRGPIHYMKKVLATWNWL